MTDQPRSLFRWREIPGSVWALGLVSLFMDLSSEMIHALLPLYLVSVLGASALEVGAQAKKRAGGSDLARSLRRYI